MERCPCCISLTLLSIGLATSVTISPLLQIAAPNVTVAYYCSKQAITVLINNSAYSNYMRQFTNRGITFQNNTVTVIATKQNNNTRFQCIDNTFTSSSEAVLIVAGPPSVPEPRILFLNSSALNLSWDEPFTQAGYKTEHYTVRVYNAVSSATVGSYEVVTNHIVFEDSGSLGCDIVIFFVTATNAIGESDAGNISSGFLIIGGSSPTPPEIHVAVTNVGNGTFDAEILVKFPPEICWRFRINYTISMIRLSSGDVVLYAHARDFEAHSGSFVIFIVNRLIFDDVHIIVARIELPDGHVVQMNSSIVMSSYLTHVKPTVGPTMLPSFPTNSPEPLVPLGYWVGYVCIVVILFGASVALIGVFIYLRHRKQRNKARDQSSATVNPVTTVIPVDTQNQTKVASSLVCNPIYAGTIYETVPDVQTRQTKTNRDSFSYCEKSKRTSSIGVRSISSTAMDASLNDHARIEEWGINVSDVFNDEPRYTYMYT